MNLTYLLNKIGITFISDDIEKYVSYSKISEDDVFISSTNYDNNLDEAIKTVNIDITALKFLIENGANIGDDVESYRLLQLLNLGLTNQVKANHTTNTSTQIVW